jgi:hypothetical protein
LLPLELEIWRINLSIELRLNIPPRLSYSFIPPFWILNVLPNIPNEQRLAEIAERWLMVKARFDRGCDLIFCFYLEGMLALDDQFLLYVSFPLFAMSFALLVCAAF